MCIADKEGGLIVDYIGIASALKKAMNDYTVRDRKNYGDTNIAKVAYPKFLEKLSVCRDFFHGYDYTKFMTGTDLERAKTISGAVNFMVAPGKEETKKNYIKEAILLHQALSLCSSIVSEELRFEAAFFESVRVLILRLMNQGGGKKISLVEMNQRINELLKQSIKKIVLAPCFRDPLELKYTDYLLYQVSPEIPCCSIVLTVYCRWFYFRIVCVYKIITVCIIHCISSLSRFHHHFFQSHIFLLAHHQGAPETGIYINP